MDIKSFVKTNNLSVIISAILLASYIASAVAIPIFIVNGMPSLVFVDLAYVAVITYVCITSIIDSIAYRKAVIADKAVK